MLLWYICSTVIDQRESGSIFDLLLLLDTGPLPVAGCPKMAVGTGIGAAPILDEGTKRTNKQIKKGMISPNVKQKCSFFCFFVQTSILTRRKLLVSGLF